MTANECWVSFQGDGSVLNLVLMIAQVCEHTKNDRICTL